MTTSFRRASLQLRTARRVVRGGGVSLRDALGPLDDRMVFVFGSPRSGTTFLARAIGSCPGFVDLGEVGALKASIPELFRLDSDAAAARIRRLLRRTRRLALVGRLRAVEQTPETAFVALAVAAALPDARLVHIVRDGRDVVCSLVERGWLSAGRIGADDAGLGFGSHSRFWIEPGREREFEAASDVRRAAWAWRRYVEASRAARPHIELRYEELTAAPQNAATSLSESLGSSASHLTEALGAAHDSSVGRWHRDLRQDQIDEIDREAGPLLRALGYLQ